MRKCVWQQYWQREFWAPKKLELQLTCSADRDSGVAPVPRPGRNREFDDYVQETFGDVDPENADVQELRRWASIVHTLTQQSCLEDLEDRGTIEFGFSQ